MKLPLILALSLGATGCITIHPPKYGASSSTPAPSQVQISSCESTRNWHNAWTMMGAVFGAGAGASGTADAITTDHTAQVGIGIGVAASGLLAAISTTAAGITADTYATDNCAAILSAAFSTGDQK
jgi:hypothetical protein